MMDNPGCFALMLGDESQADGMCYQFGGSSNTVEPLASEGRGVWRCLAVEKLSQVELRTGPWRTEPRAERQTSIDAVDFDIDAQPGDDPQNGQ